MILPQLLTPLAALRLGEYAEMVWIAAIALRTVAGVIGQPSPTEAAAAAAAARLRRLVPGVLLVLAAMVAVFLGGWAWLQQSRP